MAQAHSTVDGTVVAFRSGRTRPKRPPVALGERGAVLLFTGIRYARPGLDGQAPTTSGGTVAERD